jgi:hypothetical protein
MLKAADPKTKAAIIFQESQKNSDVGAALQMLYPDIAPVAGKKQSMSREVLASLLTGGASQYPKMYRNVRSLFAD